MDGYTTREDNSDSALKSDINRESCVRLRGKSSEATNTPAGSSELVSGRQIVALPPFVTSGHINNRDDSFQTFVQPRGSLQSSSPQLSNKGPRDYHPVPEQVSESSEVLPTVTASPNSHLLIPKPLPSITNQRPLSISESSPLLSERTEPGCAECPKSVCSNHWKIITCLIIGIFLTVGSFIGLIGLFSVPGTEHHEIHIDNNNMILLGFFDTFWYHTFEIHKGSDDQCSDCKVSVYTVYPEDLIVNDNFYNGTTDILTASQDGVLLKPHYFISGSKINLQVTFLPALGQDVLVHINLYSGLLVYDQFLKDEKPSALNSYQVNETTFSLAVSVIDTGYYFVGIDPISTPINFKFSYQVHQIYYSKENFGSPKCSVQTLSDQCSLSFPISFSDGYSEKLKKCVLIYSELPEVIKSSYYMSVHYNVFRGFWTAYSILFLLCGCLASMCTFAICFYWCVCCVRRSRKKRTSSYNSYYYSI